MSLTTLQKRIVLARDSGEVALHLATLTHADITTQRYVSNDADVTSNSLEYSAREFEWARPSEGAVASKGRLRIWNGDGVLAGIVNTPKTPISVKIDIVFASAPDTVVKSWPHFQWLNVGYSDDYAEGELGQPNFGREMWPPRVHNEGDIPGANW